MPSAQQYLEQARAQMSGYNSHVQSLAGTVDSTIGQISSLDIRSRTSNYALAATTALAVPVVLILLLATVGLVCGGSSAAWIVLGFAYPLTIMLLGLVCSAQ